MKAAVLMAAVVGLVVGADIVTAQPAEPTFEGLDKNHDGVLSKDEVQSMFDHMGANGGGQHHHAASGGGFGGQGGFGGHGGFGGGPEGGGGGFGHGTHGGGMAQGQAGGERRGGGKRPNVDEIFKSWDKDGNGTISREEFDARPRLGGRRGRGNAGQQQDLPSL
jgi:hypothetical protein